MSPPWSTMYNSFTEDGSNTDLLLNLSHKGSVSSRSIFRYKRGIHVPLLREFIPKLVLLPFLSTLYTTSLFRDTLNNCLTVTPSYLVLMTFPKNSLIHISSFYVFNEIYYYIIVRRHDV